MKRKKRKLKQLEELQLLGLVLPRENENGREIERCDSDGFASEVPLSDHQIHRLEKVSGI